MTTADQSVRRTKRAHPEGWWSILAALAAAGLLAASTGLAFAQSTTPSRTPGHEMQNKGSVKGEPGASGYAPGRQTPETTGRGSMGDRDPDRDRGDTR